MLTDTDIPPGGEAEIEVTFDSGHKKGKQDLTITVTSNDPRNPSAKLRVTAFIEVAFGFAPSSLGFGKVDRGETPSKSAKILVKDPNLTKLAQLKTSSDLILARVIDQGNEDTPNGGIAVEITLSPELPPGRINEFVTATSTDTSLPEARLRVGGKVIGDVEANPDFVSFVVNNGDSSRVTPAHRKVTIINRSDDRPLRIVKVLDSDDKMTLVLTTVQEGQRFELSVSPKDRTTTTGKHKGSIVISTDNPSQDSLAVRYTITYKE